MRLYEDIDFTTLTWVKPELDETLRQARLALESFVEDTGDVSQMRYCATYLHQVHGTLRMVELYGAAMVAEEMEQLARSLMDAGDSDRDEAFAVLMRGIVQLPDYLERLQSGHRDIPIVLLPLLNELREARGEKSLGESALFSPDLGRSLPGSAAGPAQPLGDMALREQAERLRSEYQSALLNWLRDDGSDATIGALTEVCDRLVGLVHVEPARRLFWVAGGTLEALRAGSFEASKPLKQALGRVEREIKRIAEQGEDALRRDPPLELTRQLLYYVAHAPTDYGRIREMREVFVLDRYLPSDAELEHARGSMTGHNRALLDTVSSAIKDDLLRVKDALDLHMRGGGRDLSELAAEAEVLDRVGDTLGMLGLGVPRRVVQEQRQALAEVANGQREGDEGTLLDIAGALLYVEASLDDQVAQLGQAPGANAAVAGADQGAASVALAETRKVLEVVTKEAIANFAQARQCFVAFVETGWDSAQLDDVPRLLGEVSGVLRMLELERAPDYLEALRRYTAGQLITHRRVPGVAQLDALADALSALEYFLEAVRDHRGGREGILDTCRDRLESLGCWPLEPAAAAVSEATRAEPATPRAAEVEAEEVGVSPARDLALEEADAAFQAAPAEADEAPVRSVDGGSEEAAGESPGVGIDFDEALAFGNQDLQAPDESDAASFQVTVPEMEGRAAEAAPSAPPPPPAVSETAAPVAAPTGFEGAGEEIDDEIREVFLEEFQEEIENLSTLLPAWRAQPDELDRLRPIRRVFHTLKGSGRLVGALTLGEFSWRVENALNRVLDNSRPVTPAVVSLVETAQQVLPQLRDSLAGTAGVSADLDAIKAVADRVAAGEEVQYQGAAEAEPAAPSAQPAQEQARPVEAAAPAHPPMSEERDELEPDAAAAESAEPAPEAPGAPPDADAIPVSLDPVLFEILKAEVQGHLETVDAWVAESRAAPRRVDDPLLRAVHTMNGAFAMTEIPVITELTSPLESYVKRLLAARALPSRDGVTLVGEAADAIRGLLETLEGESSHLRPLGDLPARLAAVRDTLPEPTRPLYELTAEPETDDGALVPDTVDIEPPDVSTIPDFDTPEPVAEEPVAEEPVAEEPVAEEPVAEEPVAEEPVAEEPVAEAPVAEEPVAEEPVAEEPVAEEPVAAVDPVGFALVPEADPDAGLDMHELDEELLDLFLEEAADLLDHSDELLVALRDAPSDRECITGLQRDLHTLKGGARMAGVQEIGELGHVMESLLEAAAEGKLELGRADVRVLEGAFDRLHRMVTRVGDRQAIAMPERLIGAFEAMSSGRPLQVPDAAADAVGPPAAVVEPPAAEEPVAEEPVAEEPAAEEPVAEEPVAEEPVAEEPVAEEPAAEEPVAEEPVAEEPVAEEPVAEEPVAEEPVAEEPVAEEPVAEEPVAEEPVAEEPVAEEPVAEEPVAEEPVAEEPPLPEVARAIEAGRPPMAPETLAPLSEPLAIEELGDEDEGGGIRSPQEQVRIRADLLDRLVNYAGEVAIYRARLEQQLGGFRGNLIELEATNNRLREQLRKLEIETEAQIIARYQRESDDTDRDFDPLELDRFSTLQQLTRALSESAADLTNLQASLEEQTRQYETLLLQQSRVSSDLQEGLMRTRMVPFESLVPRLRRVLRQAGTDTGKQVQLKVEGAQGEMDRNVLERMTAPLEHMLRNAVAHGLETPADRVKAGKPAEGAVRVAISREGSEVVITVSDDGRGLDFGAIREKAIQRGLLKPEVKATDEMLAAFILETGFSTAGEVSRLAGRGVGMDVVHNEIRQLGGALSIRSQPGKGSDFQIRLPFTLAVTQAVFVKIGETSYAVPIASVQGVGRIARSELEAQQASENPSFRYAGEDYGIHDLGRLLGLASAKAGESLQMPLLLARSGDLRVAICVDQVLGSREIVVKPTGPQVSSIQGIFGATVMGDGSVVIILDVAPLVRRRAAEAARMVEEVVHEEVAVRRIPLVMVVDDSITMRKVSGRVLERNNYEVVTAKDGVDAIEKMAERVPDLMLLDIEMPRMDGYELATHMRNDARLAGVPIIMITSRTGEKHRQRAFEIGVNRYLGKPYQEAELIRNVKDLLAMESADE